MKYIIDVRLKEIAAREEREKIVEERRKILELFDRKKEEQLSSLSMEELAKRLAEMTQQLKGWGSEKIPTLFVSVS